MKTRKTLSNSTNNIQNFYSIEIPVITQTESNKYFKIKLLHFYRFHQLDTLGIYDLPYATNEQT